MKKKCEKKKFQGIHDRFLLDHDFRARMIENNRDEEVCRRWDVLADEDHTWYLSEKEYFYYKNKWWLHLNKSGSDTLPLRRRSDFKQALSTLERLHQEDGGEQFAPTPYWKNKQWKSTSSSSSTWWEWQDSWSSKKSESQGRGNQSLEKERGDPLLAVLWRKHPRWLSRIQLFCYRKIVYSWQWSIVTDKGCIDNTSNDPFSRCATCNNYGYSLSWRWQDKVGLQHQEENLELRMHGETERWDVRQEDQHSAHETRHLTSECARSLLVSSCCRHTHSLHTTSRGWSPCVCTHLIHGWSERHSSTLSYPFHPTFYSSDSLSISSSSCCPSTSTRISSNTAYFANSEMGSTDESYSLTGYEPKDYYIMETYVESLTENSSPSNGSLRMWITMTPRSRRRFKTHTENMSITPNEKACLLVSRRRPCPKVWRDPLLKEQGDSLGKEVRS